MNDWCSVSDNWLNFLCSCFFKDHRSKFVKLLSFKIMIMKSLYVARSGTLEISRTRTYKFLCERLWWQWSEAENVKKGVLKNFAKFTGKYLYQGLFFNLIKLQACNFIKKETLAQVFSSEFCKISKNTFFYRTPRVVASEWWCLLRCHVNFSSDLINFHWPLKSFENSVVWWFQGE